LDGFESLDDALEEVIERLQSLERELVFQLQANEQAAAPVDLDQPFGRLSRMDAIQQQQMARAARAGQKVRLQQVKGALLRVGRGEYGLCVSCDEEIELKRLLARPETPYCIVCQSELEGRRK
jgi:DnaK suppressor protein